jgi:tetratricopeptide (TPR) repeat protein
MRVEWEAAKWIAILAIAAALALFWGMRTAANATPLEPARLPVDPMVQPMPAADPNITLWKILAQHEAGQPEEALTLWRDLQLTDAAAPWQHIAMGVAALQMDDLQAAAEHLFIAEELAPENPVTHYYLGLLRLGEARHARDWYDALGPAKVRFAAYRPHTVAPNTRGMYELVAMQEFEAAIENAAHIDRAMTLALPDHRAVPTVAPVTVIDLMRALQCEKFEAQAHNILGAMYLDRGALDQAEVHMDAAYDGGANVVFGFRDLAQQYEALGRNGDAARVYLKAMENEPGFVLPIKKVLENFGKALLN